MSFEIKTLTPASIGQVKIKNRVIFPSIDLNFYGPKGEATNKILVFFENRAKAGVGAFIIPMNPSGEDKPARGSLSRDENIAQWRPVANIIHKHGAKAFIQIHPAQKPARASDFFKPPLYLDAEGIKNLIESHAQCALRAKKAGFDGAEVFGGHGHDLSLLLSGVYNTRTDEYGGSLENRARASTELISRVRELCGPEFAIIFKLSTEERIPGGREAPEAGKIAELAQNAGADAICVSCGLTESGEWISPPSDVAQGHLAHIGRYFKETLSISVIVVGRIVDWQTAERIVNDGFADFVAVGRALLAEPRWVEGIGHHDSPLRKCIGCNQGCRAKTGATCLQNPRLGREEFTAAKKDAQCEKVCVIGGGLAGLEAANVLSRRGHEVTLFEKENRVGGLFNWASLAPGKSSYKNVVEYYEKILPEQGVEIKLDTHLEAAPKGNWNLIVLAVGGELVIPNLDVRDVIVRHVLDFYRLRDVSAEEYVILADGARGYETADFIAAQGKHVILFNNDEREPAKLLEKSHWHFMKQRFDETGLEIIRSGDVRTLDKEGFIIKKQDGSEYRVNGHYEYLLDFGCKPLSKESQEKFTVHGIPLVSVGNTNISGDARNAIRSAFDRLISYSFV
jgi:2,4-dienoyl-CoA reductase-like NADH-dependent reductase (Old Yellow Enzyme family)